MRVRVLDEVGDGGCSVEVDEGEEGDTKVGTRVAAGATVVVTVLVVVDTWVTLEVVVLVVVSAGASVDEPPSTLTTAYVFARRTPWNGSPLAKADSSNV